MKYCPNCGKTLTNQTSNFCDNCGAKINTVNPSQQTGTAQPVAQPVAEEKNPVLAAVCSLFIPGLGQVYDGKTARGFAIFFGTLIGLFLIILPGAIVWLFGIYDAYSTAKKMNNKEIPFLPTKTAHLIIFIILAIIIVAIVIAVIALITLATMVAPLAHSSYSTVPTFPPV